MAEKQVPAAGRPWDTGVGKRAVTAPWVIAGTVFFAGVSVLLLHALWQFWPPSAPPGGTPPAESTAHFLWWDLPLSREKSFLVIVAIAGALGAMGHVLRSYFRYVGERSLLWSWMLSYLLMPLVGAIIGTLVYILLRAGLITGGGAAQGDPFGFAAVAALVGLFSAQAAEKLKEVFETIFAMPQAGSESVTTPTAHAPAIRTFRPPTGPVGTPVEMEGDSLEDVTEVRFGGVPSHAEFNPDTGILKATVPANASTGKLAVTVGNVTAESETVFQVTP
jgi:hypothetical protein